MLLSESAVEALAMLVTSLWLAIVLLFIGLLRLQQRVRALEQQATGGGEQTGLTPLKQIE